MSGCCTPERAESERLGESSGITLGHPVVGYKFITFYICSSF